MNEIGKQKGVNWKEKLVAWRYLSMLGNPKTHIRNILGNAMFTPLVFTKNRIGAIAEIVTGQKERTKTFGPLKKEYKDAAKAVFLEEDVQKMLFSESKYNQSGEYITPEGSNAFGDGRVANVLNKVNDFNSRMLDKEDAIFMRGYFEKAYAGYLQANKSDVNNMTA